LYHYEEYKACCTTAMPPTTMNQQCIPADVLMKAAEEKKTKKQQMLDFQKVNKPVKFTMEGVLDVVARHVACDNQVSQVA